MNMFEVQNTGHGDYIVYYITDYIEKLNLSDEIDGLLLKSEFHVSLVKFPDGFVTNNLRAKLNEASKNAAKYLQQPRLTGQFLRAKNDARNLESIIGLVEVPGLDNWRQAIESVAGAIDFSVPHVTLYTKQPNAGIPLNSQAEFDERVCELDDSTSEALAQSL